MSDKATEMITAYKGISPQIAESAFIAPGAQIIGDVHIGEHSSVWFNCVLRGDCYYIRVGENTNIQDATIIHVTNGRFATIIGDRVTVGHSVVLHGCTVKDRSLIGIGAIVLDDVTIGEESFIAAGSLVTPGTVIPPRSMVMGSPAKVRREVTDEEVARIDQHWQHYVSYKNEYIAQRTALQK
ncbi:MAG TPA: gamma carbonic anhydrase family protein [Blastocatellia bacterium]|nr:gamma carbonic anhydrase family protein [Blastocatellia bacterium]